MLIVVQRLITSIYLLCLPATQCSVIAALWPARCCACLRLPALV